MYSGLIDKRAVRDWIVKREHLFQMPAGQSKPAHDPQVCARGQVTKDQSAGIVALAAQTQQILVQAHRQIQFAALRVIARLRMWDLKELRWGTQLLPQLARAGKDLAGLRRRV